MKIAVISDTHDHVKNLDKALSIIGRRRTSALLHCGDLCSPFVVDRLARFRGKVHIVFGNNEGDRYTINEVARKFPNITLHGEVGFLETPDGEVAFTHRPEFAKGLAFTGQYAAVFFGHTHRRLMEKIGGTWLVNPGELMGLIEGPGGVIFDLAKGLAAYFELK